MYLYYQQYLLFSQGLLFCLWAIISSFIKTELAGAVPAVEESEDWSDIKTLNCAIYSYMFFLHFFPFLSFCYSFFGSSCFPDLPFFACPSFLMVHCRAWGGCYWKPAGFVGGMFPCLCACVLNNLTWSMPVPFLLPPVKGPFVKCKSTLCPSHER